jgi:hypothetical protein
MEDGRMKDARRDSPSLFSFTVNVTMVVTTQKKKIIAATVLFPRLVLLCRVSSRCSISVAAAVPAHPSRLL